MNETLKRQILKLLDQHHTMRIATLRPDSQKAAKLARDNRSWQSMVISLIDYTRGFGHTDLVTC